MDGLTKPPIADLDQASVQATAADTYGPGLARPLGRLGGGALAAFLALGALAWLGQRTAAQSVPILRVDNTTDAVDALPGDGRCLTAAGACTLRAAVQEANARPGPDAITVPQGRYQLSRLGPEEDDAQTGDLDVREDLNLSGAGRELTVIDGLNADRVFEVQPTAALTLTDLTARDGIPWQRAGSLGDGGCILARGALRLTGVRVEECEGGLRGGAISASSGLWMVGSVVRRGQALGGGGLSAWQAWIENSDISENAATTGGGVDSEAYLHVVGSRIHHNRAASGGGIDASGTVLLQASKIEANRATSGGGIGLYRGALWIHGSSLTGNEATSAAAIDLYRFGETSVHVEASTLAANQNLSVSEPVITHSREGASDSLEVVNSTLGDDASETLSFSGAVTLTHVTMLGSLALDFTGTAFIGASILGGSCSGTAGALRSGGHNLASKPGCGLDPAGSDRIGPLALGALADNGGPTLTRLPEALSLAIDALPSSSCPELDQRGLRRPAGVGCDIGAVERGAVAPTPAVTRTAWPSPSPDLSSPSPTPGPTARPSTPMPVAKDPGPGALRWIDQQGGIGKALARMEGGPVLVARGAEVSAYRLPGLEPMGRYVAGGIVLDIAVEGRLAALRLIDAVELIDLSDAARPELRSRLAVEPSRTVIGSVGVSQGQGGVYLRSGRLWLALLETMPNAEQRLRVFLGDTTQPLSTRWTTTWTRRQRGLDGSLLWLDGGLVGATLHVVLRVGLDSYQDQVLALGPTGEFVDQGVLELGQRVLMARVEDQLLMLVRTTTGSGSAVDLLPLDPSSTDLLSHYDVPDRSTVDALAMDGGDMVLVESRKSGGDQEASSILRLRPMSGRVRQLESRPLPWAPERILMGEETALLLSGRGDLLAYSARRDGFLRESGRQAGGGALAGISHQGGWLYAVPMACSGGMAEAPVQLRVFHLPAGAPPLAADGWQMTDPGGSWSRCHPFDQRPNRWVATDGRRAYLADDGGRLYVAGLASPDQPKLLGSVALRSSDGTKSAILGMVTADGRLVASSKSRLHVLEADDTGAIAELGSAEDPNRSLPTVLGRVGDLILRYDGLTLALFDISEPTKPRSDSVLTVASSVPNGRRPAIAAGGQVALTSSSEDTEIQTVSLVDRQSRWKLSTLALPEGQVYDIAIRGATAVVAAGSAGIWVLDVSDPRRVRPVAHHAVAGTAMDVELAGDRIYVAAADGGLAVFRYPQLTKIYLPRAER